MCFGLLQMIKTTPLRRMILHRSQRGFTDARTFMSSYTLMHSAATLVAANPSRHPPAAARALALVTVVSQVTVNASGA